MNCAICVLDPEKYPVSWHAAVAVWAGTSLCADHLRERVAGAAERDRILAEQDDDTG